MAALTVQGGLVKNKMKGGSLYQTKPSRPPPLTCFFSIETPLFRQATFYLAELFCQTKRSMAELLRQIKRSVAEHVKGGGLLYGSFYRDPPFILFLTSPPCTVSAATTSDSEVNL